MNVQFVNLDLSYSIDSILLFQADDTAPFWCEPILYFYPRIDAQKFRRMDINERKEYLSGIFTEIYNELEPELNYKVVLYNDYFAICRRQIEDALSEAFEIDTRNLFNDITGCITLNPVCPRFLNEHRFDIFYMNSERGAVGITIHELIHFIWFYVWNRHFSDCYDEYERPSMKWILSEMVVESMMRDERLSTINPYFPRENGGCVYPYFQNMTIDGVPVLNTIESLYRTNRMTDFMEAAYGYCLEHENAIRTHIAHDEKSV